MQMGRIKYEKDNCCGFKKYNFLFSSQKSAVHDTTWNKWSPDNEPLGKQKADEY